MSLHVKNSGSWKQVQQVFVKDSGSWKTVLDVLVKDGGSWKSVLYEAGSQAYTSSGSNSFVVPAGVNTINYNLWGGGGGGASTQSTGSVATTPGETLTVYVAANSSGNTTTYIARGGTTLASATGSVTSYPDPVYSVESTLSTNAFSFSGNVDDQLQQYARVVGAGNSYSGSGNNGTLQSGASSAGCYYAVTVEYNHGDLNASISINEVGSYDTNKQQTAYIVSASGRNSKYINQYPTAANGYQVGLRISDGDYSEGSYAVTIGVKQGFGNTNGQGYAGLSW
jgi:hypothetical protein